MSANRLHPLRSAAPHAGRRRFVLVASALFALSMGARTQEEALDAAKPSCCSSLGDEASERGCPACRHRDDERLLPLDEHATPKERRLRELAARARAGRHAWLSDRLIPELRAQRIELEAAGVPIQVLSVRLTLAHFLLNRGEIVESIELFRSCIDWLDAHPEIPATTRIETLLYLATAELRRAERENCVAHHNQESCIFPLAGAAVHVEPAGARAAAATLEALLALAPDRRDAQWLLNIAHMALGTWPDEVPEAHRFAPARFASEAELGRFVDIAPKLGIDRYARAGSALIDDLDGDGDLDVLSASFDPEHSLRLYRNEGAGRFADATRAAGLANQLGGCGLVQGDVDGDGRLDVLVLRGGGLHTDGAWPCSLLVQTADGRFEDRAQAAGIELDAPSRCAAFADFDGDGDLDLFVGYDAWVEAPMNEVRYPSRLYANDGEGRFEDVTARAGITHPWACQSVCFDDFDGDGKPDLFLSISRTANQLWLNRGEGRFEDVAAEHGAAEPRFSSVAASLDYDADGDLDLLVGHDMHPLRDRALAQFHWDGGVLSDTAHLLENDGKGRFRDVTAERGMARVFFALSLGIGELDGDGYPDVIAGTGAPEMFSLWPNVALKNDRGRRFLDVTRIGGLGHLQKSNAIVFADIDADGDEDVYVQTGGFHPDDAFGDALFENPGHGQRWLRVELVGTRSNRFGIGARLRVRIREGTGEAPHAGSVERDVHATIGAGGSTGAGPLACTLGLGEATEIVELEVTWPSGAGQQRFASVPLDARVLVREGSAELELELER